MESIKPGDFYSPNNEKIFEAMKELFDSGKPIDSVTVSEIVFKNKNTRMSTEESSLRMYLAQQTLKDILKLY